MPRDKSHSSVNVDVESAERWVSGKTEQELLSDLKVYSARLLEDPHGIQDRLRVAAIQLRLNIGFRQRQAGRTTIHYCADGFAV